MLASILGGALLGIEQKMTPPDPIAGDAYAADLPHLPLDWASAIQAFADGRNVQQIYSRRLQRMLTECKTQELKRFMRHVTDFEFHSYLEIV